jgi:hypothetical protein
MSRAGSLSRRQYGHEGSVIVGWIHGRKERILFRGNYVVHGCIGRISKLRCAFERIAPTADISFVFIPRKVLIIESIPSNVELFFESKSSVASIDKIINRRYVPSRLSFFFPSSLQVLGDETFNSLFGLGNVFFEPAIHLTRIPVSCFRQTRLSWIVVPRSIEIIDRNSFSWCSELHQVNFEADSKLKEIGEEAFWNAGIREIWLPEQLKVIGASCFALSELERVGMCRGLEELRDQAFTQTALQSVTIPRTVRIVGKDCFKGCSSLHQILFEKESVINEIQSAAFHSCALVTIRIPANLSVLGRSCFEECRHLSQICFEQNSRLHRIEEFTFAGSNLKSFCVRSNVSFINASAFLQTDVTEICLDELNESFCLADSILYDSLHSFAIRNFSRLKKIVIPRATEILGPHSFSYCKSINDIEFEIDSKLRVISNSCFEASSVARIQIPRTVEILGEKCFKSCLSLRHIEFESHSVVNAFKKQCFSRSSLPQIVIPRSTEVVEEACFNNCNLLSDVLIESNSCLRRIERQAFLSNFSGGPAIVLPSSIEFLSSDAFDLDREIGFDIGELSPAIRTWKRIRDRRRIGDLLAYELGPDEFVDLLSDYSVDINDYESINSMFFRHTLTNREIAVTKEESFYHFRRSVHSLLRFHHPCIVEFVGIVGSESVATGMVRGCSLQKVIGNQWSFEWWSPTVRTIVICGIVHALRYIHRLGLVVSDLHPGSIVIDDEHHHPHLCRFPFCAAEKSRLEYSYHFAALTAIYQDPEIFGIGLECPVKDYDVYTFAVIAYEIITGLSFVRDMGRSFLHIIHSLQNSNRPEIGRIIERDVADLIEKCWSPAASDRPSFEEIFEFLRARRFDIIPQSDLCQVESYIEWLELQS